MAAQSLQCDHQLTRAPWSEALRFSLSALAVDARHFLSKDRWRRSPTWTWLLILLEALITTTAVTFLSNAPAGAAAGAFLLLAAITVTVVGEARGYRRAIWRTYHSSNGQRWGAYVKQRPNKPALVCSVHAHPTSAGHGTQVMVALTTWADEHQMPLTLHATCPAAVRFYRRKGFTPTAADSLGRTTMTRQTRICPTGAHFAGLDGL